MSEEINVVDIDEEEAVETQENSHITPSNGQQNSPINRLETSSKMSGDDVFETTKSSTEPVTKTEDQDIKSQEAMETVPEQKVSHQSVTVTRENQQPASSNVIRRLEERVSFRNAKTKNRTDSQILVKIENRTPNAAIKILNNITNQSPNVEMCNECRRLRPQFYRPWESDSMCNCRRTDSNNTHNSETRLNVIENRTECDSQCKEKLSRPSNSFNMSRILDIKSTASPSLETINENIPQYIATSPVPLYSTFYPNIYSSHLNQRSNLCYFGKVQEPNPYQPCYSHERFNIDRMKNESQSPRDYAVTSSHRELDEQTHMKAHNASHEVERRQFQPLNERCEGNNVDDQFNERLNERSVDSNAAHNEEVMRNPVDNMEAYSEHEEYVEEALDFSIRDGEARARSASNYSVSSSSSGYESRNSSSSELQSPPPSPQYSKYDRYYSLPNISIVSSLF